MATSKKSSSSRRPKPMIPKTALKSTAKGGSRYGCGGKLK